MKTREDWTLSLRTLWAHPLESLLLVLGLAIAIGATTSGLAMVEKARVEGDALLQQPEYREIVVSSRESADQMSTPVVLTQDETIRLSIDDLDAASLSPDIEFAYLAERTRLRFNTSSNEFPPPDAPPVTTDDATKGTSVNTDESQKAVVDERPPIEFATVDGPEPQLDEVSGYSVTTDYFAAMNLTTAEGSLFTTSDLEQGNKVIVLGSEVAKNLFADGESLNRQVASFTSIYTIIGSLKPTGTSLDTMIFMPSRLAQDSTGALAFRGPGGQGSSTTLHFSVASATQLNAAADQLSNWFDNAYGYGNTATSVPRTAVEQAIERKEKTALITVILALAGLLIANVNVSNILYSRAIRRRKQVGILMALGASRRHIFNLFLSESGVVVGIGALVGMVIALGFSALLSQSTAAAALPFYAIVLGMLAAAFIALLFTLVPAIYAARIPPAVAIRVE